VGVYRNNSGRRISFGDSKVFFDVTKGKESIMTINDDLVANDWGFQRYLHMPLESDPSKNWIERIDNPQAAARAITASVTNTVQEKVTSTVEVRVGERIQESRCMGIKADGSKCDKKISIANNGVDLPLCGFHKDQANKIEWDGKEWQYKMVVEEKIPKQSKSKNKSKNEPNVVVGGEILKTGDETVKV
jgi:hypothetical protein